MDLKISEMLEMQKELYVANQEKWDPIIPQSGRNKLLWMMEEVGEVIAIIKKKSESDIMNDSLVREAFITELADVLMYYHDVLRCYNVTSKEISNAYVNKHQRNMNRDFEKEYIHLLEKE